MGKNFPFLQSLLIPSLALFILAILLKLTFFKSVYALWFKGLTLAIGFILGITLGHSYANQQLSERLKFREQQTEQRDVIVYVKNLNELHENSDRKSVV